MDSKTTKSKRSSRLNWIYEKKKTQVFCSSPLYKTETEENTITRLVNTSIRIPITLGATIEWRLWAGRPRTYPRRLTGTSRYNLPRKFFCPASFSFGILWASRDPWFFIYYWVWTARFSWYVFSFLLSIFLISPQRPITCAATLAIGDS